MDKHEFILRTSLILNQTALDDAATDYFKDKKHDILLKEFRDYILANTEYLGAIDADCLQALNDHGVDIMLKSIDNTRIGFQIKSHFDVNEVNFAANVKRQLAESFTYGLDKWYLIICSPIKTPKKNYEAKISFLINEINSYKTDYYSIISPQSAVSIFKNNKKRDEQEFNNNLNLYNYKQIEPELKRNIEVNFLKYNIDSVINNDSSKGIKHTTAKSFIDYLKFEHEFNESQLLSELDAFYTKLQTITFKDRQFYSACIMHCYDKGTILGRTSSVYIPLSRLADDGFTKIDITQRVAALEVAGLFATDPDDDNEARQRLAYLKPQSNIDEIIIPYEIKKFTNSNKKSDNIISNLNFDLLN